jgi:DNA-binding transcriptional ArsR family regulator
MIETFTALSEPNRLRIVELLRDGPQAVGAIADSLGLNQPQVSKHLNTLKKARLVEVEARAQQRVYRLDAQGLLLIDQWLDRYRRIWTGRLNELDDVISEMTRKDKE